ncbi:hypothetical protein [Haladaptatus halobius]|uniref:hypothetical protein n=1 Tax=Haladaptatus halobius TaxID=2884875 RepID=UPI001D0A4117|nr:hypothetical protein [Haladaptatus halobius]
MTESSPALYALAVVVVAGFVLSVGGNAFSFSAENSVHSNQNRTGTTNPCPTTGTTDDDSTRLERRSRRGR